MNVFSLILSAIICFFGMPALAAWDYKENSKLESYCFNVIFIVVAICFIYMSCSVLYLIYENTKDLTL